VQKKQLVYDLPTRIFHWSFGALFGTAFGIAKFGDDESSLYAYHMLAGLTLGGLVLLRVLWGLVGTRHARFSGFALSPGGLVSYFRGILTGDKRRWSGHNPASSYAAVAMILFSLGLVLTGTLMTTQGSRAKETFEEIHELLANALLITALLHVAGVALHTLRHRELIGLSMVDGKKAGVPPGEQIPSARPFAAFLLLVATLALEYQLLRNYDPSSGRLEFLGTSFSLGEGDAETQDEPGS
jgi:cytochrome b